MIILDERKSRELIMSPTCTTCRHLNRDRARTCMAFPDPIPDEIWNGLHDHRTPYPGDHDIRYEPMSAEDLADLKEWVRQRKAEIRERWGDRASEGIRPWAPREVKV